MPDPITATVVCHTVGCENNGLLIAALWRLWDDDSGAWLTVESIVCGGCGQPITDVTTPSDTGSDSTSEGTSNSDSTSDSGSDTSETGSETTS